MRTPYRPTLSFASKALRRLGNTFLGTPRQLLGDDPLADHIATYGLYALEADRPHVLPGQIEDPVWARHRLADIKFRRDLFLKAGQLSTILLAAVVLVGLSLNGTYLAALQGWAKHEDAVRVEAAKAKAAQKDTDARDAAAKRQASAGVLFSTYCSLPDKYKSNGEALTCGAGQTAAGMNVGAYLTMSDAVCAASSNATSNAGCVVIQQLADDVCSDSKQLHAQNPNQKVFCKPLDYFTSHSADADFNGTASTLCNDGNGSYCTAPADTNSSL